MLPSITTASELSESNTLFGGKFTLPIVVVWSTSALAVFALLAQALCALHNVNSRTLSAAYRFQFVVQCVVQLVDELIRARSSELRPAKFVIQTEFDSAILLLFRVESVSNFRLIEPLPIYCGQVESNNLTKSRFNVINIEKEIEKQAI